MLNLWSVIKNFFSEEKIPGEFKEAFYLEFFQTNITAAKIIAAIAIIGYPLFGLTGIDYFYAPDYYRCFFLIRAIVSIASMLIYFLATREPFLKYGDYLGISVIYLTGWGIVIMLLFIDGYKSPYYAGLNIIYLASAILPLNYKKSLLACLGIYGFYLLLPCFDGSQIEVKFLLSHNQFQLWTIFIIVILCQFKYKLQVKGILNRLVIEDESKKLIKANDTIQTMVKAFTHDIKNKLAGAEMTLNAYQAKLVGEDDKHLFISILEIKRASLNSVNQMNLLVAETDQLHLRKEPVKLNLLGKKLKEGWGKVFLNRGIDFTVELPDLAINVDVEYMNLVWENLAANAFNHTPIGGMFEICVDIYPHTLEIKFMNSGNLIPEEVRDELFSKDKNVAYKNPYNKGFGLSFSKMIVELHGGSIHYEVENKLNVFVIEIPR